MKILFLHGWHSVPGGKKPSYLASHGHEVINPALDDDDFDQAVRTAQAEYDRHQPDVIVGSSRGGAVAMNLDSGSTPLVLLCPAWKRWGTAKTVRPGTVILHSEADDVIPIAESRELVGASRLPESALVVVGSDHRLADPKPLRSMLLACEFACLPKSWYSIYQWGPTARDGYTELVASLITAWLDQIGLGVSGLRQKEFRVADHRGQATLRTDIAQFTEKRFCRALFNLGQVSGLGRVIDYEVPLKAVRGAKHGNIDLLCSEGARLLIVEAKEPSSKESLLRAVLEAFTYCCLVAKERGAFLKDYGLRPETSLVPAVLTFPTATSGRQIDKIGEYPRLRILIRLLNDILNRQDITPLRFFLVSGEGNDWDSSLRTENLSNREVRVVFREGLRPGVVEVELGVGE